MFLDDNVILTDCDGVLLNWRHTFFQWMLGKGYTIHDTVTYGMEAAFNISKTEKEFLVNHFNESAAIGSLAPYKDAIHYVKKLHEEHGYVFHVITSLTTEPYACELRKRNLIRLFGEGIFEKFVFLGTGEDKGEALSKYQNTGLFWVEDKPENAQDGSDVGLSPILMNHKHNIPIETSNSIKRVDNWKDVYYYIIGE